VAGIGCRFTGAFAGLLPLLQVRATYRFCFRWRPGFGFGSAGMRAAYSSCEAELEEARHLDGLLVRLVVMAVVVIAGKPAFRQDQLSRGSLSRSAATS
jgi:hypothetical protein